MKKITKTIINKVSSIDYDIEKVYQFQRKIQEFGKFFVSKKAYIDTYILTNDYNVPIRIFFPVTATKNAIIYYHGGGWVVGNVDYYTKTCHELALRTNSYVISVDYRLAPEYPYPAALNDCYEVTKHFCHKNNILDLKEKNITIMGDSAGGTLAIGISMLSRDKKEFKIKNEILLYPLTYHDHSINSPFASVTENGEDWILTAKKMNEYMKLYVQDDKLLTSPYVTPLNATNFTKMPDTLLITAELDLLRDEGEAFGIKLSKCNNVSMHRINDAIHGFFNLPLSKHKEITFNLICEFLKGDK